MLRRALSALLLGTSLGLAALTGPAVAQSASVPPPDIAARSWFLFDVTTNTVLYSQTPDERVEPASLTKLMTAYVVFEALRDGTLKPDARPPVSNRAYKSAGSRMFVDPRSPATVDELLHGLIIQSGNDAAIILAEAVAGSEEQFAEQMNAEARRLGMKNSHFVNASGLPAPDHYSSRATWPYWPPASSRSFRNTTGCTPNVSTPSTACASPTATACWPSTPPSTA